MASTKEKITATALALFAQRGYDGVSVRDICKQVGIKESSLYYHFPSKHAILTTLLSHFENRAAEGMAQLEQALGDQQGPWGQVSYRMVCQAFFEGYLMDPFCNQVLRLLQMEQFHNPDLGEIYERWMFRVPLAFQGRMFTALVDLGLLHPATGEDLAVAFYGPIHLFAQRWLFRGPGPRRERRLRRARFCSPFPARAPPRRSTLFSRAPSRRRPPDPRG